MTRSSSKIRLRRKLTAEPKPFVPPAPGLSVSMEELVGLHWLSGFEYVPQFRDQRSAYSDAPAALLFVLDGVTYAAIENPNDGYRSSMEGVEVCDAREAAMCKNRFEPTEVRVQLDNSRESPHDDDDNECMEFIDTTTKERVLWVGTTHGDYYYPHFVSEVNPEGLKWNMNVAPPPPRMGRRRFRI